LTYRASWRYSALRSKYREHVEKLLIEVSIHTMKVKERLAEEMDTLLVVQFVEALRYKADGYEFDFGT